MMDTSPSQTDESMREGLGLNVLLVLGAVVGAVGWGATQILALDPGLALGLFGVDSAVAVVALWAVLSVAMVAVGVLAGARVVRYSPLLWFWGALVGTALALNAAVVFGLVPRELGRVLLWSPWPVVIGVGFAVTSIVATHRNRGAYAVGSVGAGLVLLAAVLFPSTVTDWAFVTTGVVHAAPLLVDAATDDGSDDAAASSYEFRDVHDATVADDRRGEHR